MPATHSQLNFAHASSSSVVDPFIKPMYWENETPYKCRPYIESATALSDKQLMKWTKCCCQDLFVSSPQIASSVDIASPIAIWLIQRHFEILTCTTN